MNCNLEIFHVCVTQTDIQSKLDTNGREEDVSGIASHRANNLFIHPLPIDYALCPQWDMLHAQKR